MLPQHPSQEIERGSSLLGDVFKCILETDMADEDLVLAGTEACVCFLGEGVEGHADFAAGFDTHVIMEFG